MKMRKLTLAMMLMVGAWYSALAYTPSAGGEEKGMKADGADAVSTMATTAMVLPADESIGQPGQSNQSISSENIGSSNEDAAKSVDADNSAKESAATTSTSRKDLRNSLKALRKEVRGKDAPAAPSADDMLILCVILCFFLPPLAVYLWENAIGINFWISLILCLLFWVPGVIFSLIVVLTT